MTYKREACILEIPSISNIFMLLFTKGNENIYALIVDIYERIPRHLQGLTGRPPTIRSGPLGHKLEDRGCVSIIGLLKMIKILKFSPSEDIINLCPSTVPIQRSRPASYTQSSLEVDRFVKCASDIG